MTAPTAALIHQLLTLGFMSAGGGGGGLAKCSKIAATSS